ncbi:MAG: hypothetical protein ACYC8S_03825 [Minisyncoccota bacterium]
MKCLTSVAVIVFQFFIVVTVYADGRNPGDMELNIWGVSYHPKSAPARHTFNQVNPGIGLRRYFKNIRGVEVFGDVEFMNKNSTGGHLFQVGVGGQYPVLSLGHTDVLVGVAAGILSYENKWMGETYVVPGAYPFVGVRHKNVALTVGYVPPVSAGKGGGYSAYAAYFAYASVRF